METAISKDGTAIAYERTGEGLVIILVSGALGERSAALPLATILGKRYTVIAYDRRGRGDSGDTLPYAVEREIEDIEALIRSTGGSAFLYGHSSGAALALEASASGLAIPRLALYEPPYIVDSSRERVSPEYVDHLNELIASGQRGDAVEYFMASMVNVPVDMIAQMHSSPMWSSMEKIAHTLAYDGMIMGGLMSGKPLPARRWSSVTQPVLVMDGGASPAWIRHTANELSSLLQNATHLTLENQTHAADEKVLAPALEEFFEAG